MKYLKKFENHAAYAAAESGLILPNVSLCVQENEVHYNPLAPPQPIAPVGKVQVFANPQCTEYADTEIPSSTVYVRLNQAFGYGDVEVWYGRDEEKLAIITPDSENPSDPYKIQLWYDWESIDYNEPFISGQVIECTNPYGEGDQGNWKVIFE